MCMAVDISCIKIAKRDIHTWKFVKPLGESKWEPAIISGMGEYKMNEILKPRKIIEEELTEIDNLELDLFGGIPIVHEGFYSHLRKPNYLNNKSSSVCHSIIPKGSEYVTGMGNDVRISSRIIVFSSIWKMLRYKIEKYVFNSKKWRSSQKGES